MTQRTDSTWLAGKPNADACVLVLSHLLKLLDDNFAAKAFLRTKPELANVHWAAELALAGERILAVRCKHLGCGCVQFFTPALLQNARCVRCTRGTLEVLP